MKQTTVIFQIPGKRLIWGARARAAVVPPLQALRAVYTSPSTNVLGESQEGKGARTPVGCVQRKPEAVCKGKQPALCNGHLLEVGKRGID